MTDLIAALALLAAPEDVAPCRDLAPEIAHAAEVAGLTPAQALAWVWTESRCRSVDGRSHDVAGPLQVRWRTWGALLGPEGWREDELAGGWGVLAGARVLAHLRSRHPGRTTEQTLCLYGVGSAALTFRRDCTYSRQVMRLAGRINR